MRVRAVDTTATEDDLADLFLTVTTIDSRLIRLVREGDREIGVDDLTTELSVLSRDLRRLYQKITDLTKRRDLTFSVQQKLRGLQDECIWLYRKAQNERTFFRKLALETHLRRLISDEAYNVYQEILWVEDEERRLGVRDDAGVAALLLAESEEPNLS